MSKRQRSWLVWGGLCSVLIVLAAVFVMLSHDSRGDAPETPAAKPQAAPISVTVAPIMPREIQRAVEVVGTFSGREEVIVTPEVDGRVIKIYHDMGDVVHPGDVLLEIDPTDYQLAVEQAAKSMESELAKLGLKELPAGEIDLKQLPTVVRAENIERNAARKLARAQQLFQRKITPQEELDQQETDYRVAAATLRQTIMDAQAILAKARHEHALLATAQKRLADTRVKAPSPTTAVGNEAVFSVAERMISEGEMARRTSPTGVFRLVIDATLKFQAAVPERYVGQVKNDQTVHLQVEAYPDRVFEGRITRVSPTVDRVSRTFQIEALVPNESRELKAGGFAKAAILTRVDPHANTIPIEALVTSAGVMKVFVLKDGKAHETLVTPGVSGRGWIEILDKLPADTQVITSGQNNLSDGAAVSVHQ